MHRNLLTAFNQNMIEERNGVQLRLVKQEYKQYVPRCYENILNLLPNSNVVMVNNVEFDTTRELESTVREIMQKTFLEHVGHEVEILSMYEWDENFDPANEN